MSENNTLRKKLLELLEIRYYNLLIQDISPGSGSKAYLATSCTFEIANSFLFIYPSNIIGRFCISRFGKYIEFQRPLVPLYGWYVVEEKTSIDAIFSFINWILKEKSEG